ncbi:hypothetical protein [Adhaeribacter radiodurans]|uniref:Uncharacterized protein n=1 Tax=Adhaeribacter radiodurans TaxID=2745197 RepID=A0A7L7L8J2_9BACT|nr:hypothetical protein [Adhaeribacter radiodurans]QMU29152.1 hypothetical protein HUW48_14365 [Adhaeribacter radiodurans]
MGFKAVSPEELSELKGFVNSLDPEFLHSLPKEEGSAINVLRQFAEHNIDNH